MPDLAIIEGERQLAGQSGRNKSTPEDLRGRPKGRILEATDCQTNKAKSSDARVNASGKRGKHSIYKCAVRSRTIASASDAL
jgi:hypothetical protein